MTVPSILLLLLSSLSTYVNALPQQHWAVSGDPIQHPQTPECKSDTYNEHDQEVITGNGVSYGTGIGVQCCDEWGVGTRPGCEDSMGKIGVDEVKYSFTYAEAVEHCESYDMRLCTREEVDNGAGEGTGCAFDANLVWTSTRCYGRHWAVDGSKQARGSAMDECRIDTSTSHEQDFGNGLDIGVQCCDNAGVKGSRPGCQQGKTYDEAYEICKAEGLRLCTREEVSNGVGAGTGCDFDVLLVWTSTACEKDEDNLDCTALDIDKFLTDCSTDFETSELQINSLKIALMKLKNEVEFLKNQMGLVDVAHANAGLFNLVQKPSSPKLKSFGFDKDELIYGLVLLNVGLIIGCIACLRIRRKSIKQVSVYGDVRQCQDEDEES